MASYTKIVKQTITITRKSELIDFAIKMPKNALRIKGVLVLNDVRGSIFANGGAYTPTAPPLPTLAGTLTLKTTSWFYAVATKPQYDKWDRIEKENTFVITNGVLTGVTTRYTNHHTGLAIATVVIADLVHESEPEFKHEDFIRNQSFVLTNAKQDYPYGLTIPITYKFVKVIAEANINTTDAQKQRIARLGKTSDLSSTVGVPLSENGSMDISKVEFEDSSMIALQALNHVIQLQFIN